MFTVSLPLDPEKLKEIAEKPPQKRRRARKPRGDQPAKPSRAKRKAPDSA